MLPLAVALEVHPGEAPIEAAVLRQDERAAQSPAAELQHCDGLLFLPLHAPAGRSCGEPGAICLIVRQMQWSSGALSASLGPGDAFVYTALIEGAVELHVRVPESHVRACVKQKLV